MLHAAGCSSTRDAVEQKGCDGTGPRFLQKVLHLLSPSPCAVEKDLTRFILNLPDDLVAQLLSRLKTSEQQLLFLLLQGCAFRDAARELGISPPTARKRCKRIARISRALLQKSGMDSDPVALHQTANAPAG